ncbi:MAG: glycerate kinase [Planctomycetes bacterium]|nr:glycerate kinase [Planctomycetota bacterium]
MKIIVAPSNFKGSLKPREVAEAIERGIRRAIPDANLVLAPFADGGEGTLDAFAQIASETISIEVPGPDFRKIQASYLIIDAEERTAIVELAQASGLSTITRAGRTPDLKSTSTFGTGVLIRDALSRGCTRIVLGLGDSATMDLGAGILEALGVRFIDSLGESFRPTSGTIGQVSSIDITNLVLTSQGASYLVLTDVQVPLLGERGTARVFAKQKGARVDELPALERGMEKFAGCLCALRGKDARNIPGSGAAGGVFAGLYSVFGNVRMHGGAEYIFDNVYDLEGHLGDADLAIAGEGRLDAQTLSGKGIQYIARRAKAQGVPAVAIVGETGEGFESIYEEGIASVFPLSRTAESKQESMLRASAMISDVAEQIARLAGAMLG